MTESLHLSSNAYSKVEQGKTQISVERLEQIAKIFNMKKEDIENFDEKVILAGIVKIYIFKRFYKK